MKQVVARVVAKGKHIRGLYRPHGRSIKFSQTIRLKCPEIARKAMPGQFVMVNCGADCVLPRPFSIHRVINQEELELYFAVLESGKGTNWLSERNIGDSVELAIPFPLGNGFLVKPASRHLLLVAGGMGIAPLYFLAEETLKRGCSVTLLYGTAVKNWYVQEHLASEIRIISATEDGTFGHHGLVTNLLPEFTAQADQVFACGPVAMYRDMALKKRELRLEGKPVQISLEVRMGCGRGLCYGCTVKTKLGLKKVCQDGPVFDLDDVLWDELTPS